MFVGEVFDAESFFALVADKPKGADQRREVSAYLCDGKQLNEWFVATTSNNTLALSSENGVNVDLKITPEQVTGTITTSDGETAEEYDFKATPAKDIEGYYPVAVPSGDGKLEGTSWSGAKLAGTRSGPQISVKLTPPGGGKVEAVSFQAPTIGAGENRWTVLQEGGQLRIKGAKRQATSSGFMNPTTGLKKPGFIDPTSGI